MKKSKGKSNTIRIYCDGAGSGPDGKQSGFAWLREDTGQRHVERMDGLTNNEAEYRAVISALKPLPAGSGVEVFTDSLLVVSQLRGEYRIREPRLARLAAEVQTSAQRKRLHLKVSWVPRGQNRAGKLI